MDIEIERNPGCELDLDWLQSVHVNYQAIKKHANRLISTKFLEDEYQIAWLLKALTCIDLTTLCGDDTLSNVSRLCNKAAKPLSEDIITKLGFDGYSLSCPIKTAAVCVYPSRVLNAVETLEKLKLKDKIKVASVATGFPTGQYPLHTRKDEIKYAVDCGADEIDIVIDRSLVITGQWCELYRQIKEMRASCGNAHMKTILAIGELENMTNVYKASLVAMMAGSDFIKTSTGKESINATIPVGIVMCRAIQEYYEKTGFKVGLKPAGGIRNCADAISWLVLIKEELDESWMNPSLFRIGASGLLGDIEQHIYHYVTGKYPASYECMMG